MKKDLYVFINRGVTSKFVKSLIEQVAILREYENRYNFVWVSYRKTDDGLKYTEEVSGIRFSKSISTAKLYEEQVYTKKHSTWVDFYNKEDWFPDSENCAGIIVYGGLLSSATNMNRTKNSLNKLIHTWQQMNFLANGMPMSTMFQLLKLSNKNKVPLHEICYDTLENSIIQQDTFPTSNVVCYHGYDIPRYSMNRLDSLQYYINKYRDPLFDRRDSQKEYDLVFGYTAITKDREEEYDKITSLINSLNIRKKTFTKHTRLKIDTFVDRDTYLDHIAMSRFTFIIRPYDKTHFSVFRMIESIDNNCLPLICSDVKTDEFRDTFGIDQNILDEIRFDYQNYPYITEERRIQIIEYFKDKLLRYEKGLRIE